LRLSLCSRPLAKRNPPFPAGLRRAD